MRYALWLCAVREREAWCVFQVHLRLSVSNTRHEPSSTCCDSLVPDNFTADGSTQQFRFSSTNRSSVRDTSAFYTSTPPWRSALSTNSLAFWTKRRARLSRRNPSSASKGIPCWFASGCTALFAWRSTRTLRRWAVSWSVTLYVESYMLCCHALAESASCDWHVICCLLGHPGLPCSIKHGEHANGKDDKPFCTGIFFLGLWNFAEWPSAIFLCEKFFVILMWEVYILIFIYSSVGSFSIFFCEKFIFLYLYILLWEIFRYSSAIFFCEKFFVRTFFLSARAGNDAQKWNIRV